MSRGLGKVEKKILDICQECLAIKGQQLIKIGRDYKVNVYSGGYRKFRDGEYSRVIQTVDGVRDDIPENIIDLREVAYLYHQSFMDKRKRFVEHTPSREASFSRATKTLEKKGYFVRGPINQNQLRFIELKS